MTITQSYFKHCPCCTPSISELFSHRLFKIMTQRCLQRNSLKPHSAPSHMFLASLRYIPSDWYVPLTCQQSPTTNTELKSVTRIGVWLESWFSGLVTRLGLEQYKSNSKVGDENSAVNDLAWNDLNPMLLSDNFLQGQVDPCRSEKCQTVTGLIYCSKAAQQIWFFSWGPT